MPQNKLIPLVLSGGSGKRIGGTPKQYSFWGSKMLIEHTVANYIRAGFQEFAIAHRPEFTELLQKMALNNGVMIHSIEGGKTRQESIYNALVYLHSHDKFGSIIIQNSVSPCTSSELILKCLNSYTSDSAISAYIEINDPAS